MPLNFGEEYASGLTVYMDLKLGKIIGLVSHGSSDFVLGQAEYEVDEADAAYDDVLNPSTREHSSGTLTLLSHAASILLLLGGM